MTFADRWMPELARSGRRTRAAATVAAAVMLAAFAGELALTTVGRAGSGHAGYGVVRSVAEGVEDAETLDRIAEYGVTVAQGFHIARPLPAAELERWLAARAVAV